MAPGRRPSPAVRRPRPLVLLETTSPALAEAPQVASGRRRRDESRPARPRPRRLPLFAAKTSIRESLRPPRPLGRSGPPRSADTRQLPANTRVRSGRLSRHDRRTTRRTELSELIKNLTSKSPQLPCLAEGEAAAVVSLVPYFGSLCPYAPSDMRKPL